MIWILNICKNHYIVVILDTPKHVTPWSHDLTDVTLDGVQHDATDEAKYYDCSDSAQQHVKHNFGVCERNIHAYWRRRKVRACRRICLRRHRSVFLFGACLCRFRRKQWKLYLKRRSIHISHVTTHRHRLVACRIYSPFHKCEIVHLHNTARANC